MQSFETALEKITGNHVTDLYAEDFDDVINPEKLAAAFKQNTSLKSVSLDSAKLSKHDTIKLIQSLTGHKRLESLSVSKLPLGDEGATALSALLRETPSLCRIDAASAGIGDEGAKALAKAMQNHPSFYVLDASYNQMGKEGLSEIVRVVADDMKFVHLDLSVNPGCEETFPQNEAVLNASRNKNLLIAAVQPKGAKSHIELTINNSARANYFESQLSPFQNPEIQHPLSAAELRELDRQALGVKMRLRGSDGALDALMNSLPSATAKQDLFTSDLNGYAPLDNPRLWKSPEDAITTLDSISLTTDVLEKKTRKGSTLLNAAAHAVPPQELMDYLNAKGVKLGADKLLESDGTPSELLTQIIEKPHGEAAVFSEDNWLGKHPSEAQKVFNALPDNRRDAPIHSLRQKMTAQSRSSDLGR